MRNKVVLKVKRFYQRDESCGVASCASLANFYDRSLNLRKIRKTPFCLPRDGMHTSEQGALLNHLGFTNLFIVTADTSYFDFSWSGHSIKWKLKRIKKFRDYCKNNNEHSDDDVYVIETYLQFLEAKRNHNDLIIDWDFPKWIRSSIRKGNPVIASINYTSYYKMPKIRKDMMWDDIKGAAVDHAFVIRGFDKEFIYIVDSAGKKTEHYNGYYKIRWGDFLINIGKGELLFKD